MHRRENQGEPMRRVFKTLKSVLADYPDVELVYPVHLSPAVQKGSKGYSSKYRAYPSD